jgi:UDP-N-acetylglucosamine 1-carboxyvinyltransferase
MSTLLIEGGHRLEGRVAVEGNKNAALPLLAACLLTEEECVLTNVPRIGDVEVMARLLLDIGAEVEGIGTTTLRIRTPRINTDNPDRSLVGRPSRLGAPPRATARADGARAYRAARRRLSRASHDLDAHRGTAGARRARTTRARPCPRGAGRPETSVDVSLRSIGHRDRDGAARGGSAPGITEIRHAATEPHVVELCEFLTKMGATVTGIGSSKLRIEGISRLRGASHKLGGDYIEAGSWAVVGAITGGEIAIEGCREEDIEVVAAVMQRMRVDCGMRNGVFEVRPSKPQAVRRIATGLWPSFPSDLVSLVTVLATQAAGRTLVHDWMYELRLFALEQMSGMGADLFLADAHRIIVTGPTKLRGGRTLDSRDLRSGMSLIAAGLAAEGQTRVAPLETVERGYSQLVDRLEALGAKVAKVE